jgi:hypothetical protein
VNNRIAFANHLRPRITKLPICRSGPARTQLARAGKSTVPDSVSLVRKFNQYPLVLDIRHESWNDPEILGTLAMSFDVSM